MKWSWRYAAKYVEEELGGFVDWDEEFFTCPECGEPIYRSDWSEHGQWEICPVCGYTIGEEEEEE